MLGLILNPSVNAKLPSCILAIKRSRFHEALQLDKNLPFLMQISTPNQGIEFEKLNYVE